MCLLGTNNDTHEDERNHNEHSYHQSSAPSQQEMIPPPPPPPPLWRGEGIKGLAPPEGKISGSYNWVCLFHFFKDYSGILHVYVCIYCV